MNEVQLLELHYHLRDGAHAMDAQVRNRCEAEVLAYFEYVFKQLGVDVTIETTVHTEGGIREIWRFVTNRENAAVVGALAAVAALPLSVVTIVIAIWALPASPDKELEALNKELAKLTLEEKRMTIQVLKEGLRRQAEAESQQQSPPASNFSFPPALPGPPRSGLTPVATPAPDSHSLSIPRLHRADSLDAKSVAERFLVTIDHAEQLLPSVPGVATDVVRTAVATFQGDTRVMTRRSNFFKSLLAYDKVTAVGMRAGIDSFESQSRETVVERQQFRNFVMATDKLPTRVVEDAVIEIIAPVIKAGNTRWKGMYDGRPISFVMGDAAFKDLVFRRVVSFGSGDSIRCVLNIESKVDGLGEQVITGHTVSVVIAKIDSNGEQDTLRGKRHKFASKQASGQGGLFDRPPKDDPR